MTTTTSLPITCTIKKIRDHDHRMVSDRWSDRVEHTTALSLLTPHADAQRGGDSVLHLAPPSPFRPLSFSLLSASSS